MRNIIMTRNKGMGKLSFVPFILGLFVLALSGCNQESPSKKAIQYQENYEIVGSEKDELLGNVSDAIFKTSDRSNKGAEELFIKDVSKGEISVPSGRYRIAGEMTGNVYIHDENGNLLYHAIVGSPYGVESITVDLDETDTITMDGFDQAYVMPAETQLSTELTAGIWEVGTDIEAGDYAISSPYGLGYLQIFDQNEDPVVFEVIGGGFEGTESDIQLRNGQKLRITDISMIHFENGDSPPAL